MEIRKDMKLNIHPLRDPQKDPEEDNPDLDPFTLDKNDVFVIIGLLIVLVGLPMLFHIFYVWMWPPCQ